MNKEQNGSEEDVTKCGGGGYCMGLYQSVVGIADGVSMGCAIPCHAIISPIPASAEMRLPICPSYCRVFCFFGHIHPSRPLLAALRMHTFFFSSFLI